MSIGILNEKNPLTKFKRANPYVGWKAIGKDVGLSQVTMIRMAKLELEDVKEMKLKHYLNLRDKVGVDMLENWG